MFARIPQREAHRGTTARQAAARLRRLAAALAAVTCTLLASAAVMPAAWAVSEIPPGGPAQVPAVGAVTAGGMPGWQITLIALGAALVAATAAVLMDRARPPAGQPPRYPPREAPAAPAEAAPGPSPDQVQARHPPMHLHVSATSRRPTLATAGIYARR
jgi:hypothetical protein